MLNLEIKKTYLTGVVSLDFLDLGVGIGGSPSKESIDMLSGVFRSWLAEMKNSYTIKIKPVLGSESKLWSKM